MYKNEREDFLDVYCRQVRSLLELAMSLWYSTLTGEDRAEVERVQKSACSIILGGSNKSYRSALKELQIDTLYKRRNKLCKTFAVKSLKHLKFSKWFKPKTKTTATRCKGTSFHEVFTRTERLKRSPISFLTNMLNNQ